MQQITLHAVTFSDSEPSYLSVAAKSLFKAYNLELQTLHGIDLSAFQDFENEMSSLPSKYDFAKGGGVWIARVSKFGEEDDPNGSGSDSDTSSMPQINKKQNYKVLGPNCLPPGRQRALKASDFVGIVALRPLPSSLSSSSAPETYPINCEIKRMFVQPSYRGLGVAGALSSNVVNYAATCGCGYMNIMLDTVERLKDAVGLYLKLGFMKCEKYCECDEDDHLCLIKKIGGGDGGATG